MPGLTILPSRLIVPVRQCKAWEQRSATKYWMSHWQIAKIENNSHIPESEQVSTFPASAILINATARKHNNLSGNIGN